jgi:hypothetical protein
MTVSTAVWTLLVAGATSALNVGDASGEFKTKGHSLALTHALAVTIESKLSSMGKDQAETVTRVVLSDKAFNAAALVGDDDPWRALNRQANALEASYLQLELGPDGKLRSLQWAPNFQTGLTWQGSPAEVATLEVSARDKKHVVGRVHPAPGVQPVDWSFDLSFDAPLVPSSKP